MKIRKFNEGEFNEPKKVLCIYNAGGYVEKTIIFDNHREMNNFILNFVNNFILDVTLDEFDKVYFEEELKSIKDEEGNYIIIDPDTAYEWLNTYNDSSEPTLSICNYQEMKNVKLDDRIAIALSANKYNL